MSTGAVIGMSLPKIAPASTPIHMSPAPSVKYNKSPTIIKIVDTSTRNKSAPANLSKTLLTSYDYGAHAHTYKRAAYDVYPPFITETDGCEGASSSEPLAASTSPATHYEPRNHRAPLAQ
ncbi:hypothetical protein EB796_014890 [Bugula neritina]|uniref:Uncharacterized protein n=1 Tax=Bugula neritina TaxID=10212 RepID=A0A7J7JKB3_BUGNE|nr:hypothetical protein EB796_014890 [Bugula neritina]